MDYLIPMIGVGLVTSVHCVAMCGSLVVTYAVKDETSGPWYRRVLPHAAYQTAKIMSYMIVGVALGFLGAALDLGGIRGWVTIAAGLFMIVLGLNMTGRFPFLARLTLRPPKFLKRALSRTRRKASDQAAAGEASVATPVTFGLLTGLMPCGPLQAAQLTAAGAGSAAAGALTMLGFGLGTAPLMLGFGAVSGVLSARFKQRMLVVAALVIIVLGLVMLNRGALIVGSPVTAQTVWQSVAGAPAVEGEFTRAADGVVEIPLVISDTQFRPNTLSFPENETVRLVVDRQEDTGCSDQLAIPQLGVLADLAPFTTTVIEVPAAEGGSYTLTCGMGMMYGLLQVGAGATGPNVGTQLLVGSLVLGVVGFGLWRTRREPAQACATGSPGEEAEVARILGFTPQEVIAIVAVVAAAVIAGLLFGGMFNY